MDNTEPHSMDLDSKKNIWWQILPRKSFPRQTNHGESSSLVSLQPENSGSTSKWTFNRQFSCLLIPYMIITLQLAREETIVLFSQTTYTKKKLKPYSFLATFHWCHPVVNSVCWLTTICPCSWHTIHSLYTTPLPKSRISSVEPTRTSVAW